MTWSYSYLLNKNRTRFNISYIADYTLMTIQLKNGGGSLVHFDFNKWTSYRDNSMNCGTFIRATSKMIILACPSFNESRGIISIYTRPSDPDKITLLYELIGAASGDTLGAGSTYDSKKGFQIIEHKADE